MNKNMKKIFLKGDHKNIPTLYWEMIFVELTRPLLFSCLDESGNRYICSCHRADGEQCEWIVVPTTCERLIELLTDQITIRQIFDADEKQGFLVTLRAGEEAPTARAVEVKELPPEILPTAGCYMEADPGEFDELLSIQLGKKISVPIPPFTVE